MQGEFQLKREGINDRILKRITDYQSQSIAKIGELLNGERPFASVQVKPADILDAVDTLGYLDMPDLVAEFGAEKINQFLYEVQRLRR